MQQLQIPHAATKNIQRATTKTWHSQVNKHINIKKRPDTSVVIRKVQIKTRKRYYFISIKMTTTKKIYNKCWWRCGEIRTFTRCWQAWRLVQLLWENCSAVLKKKENTELPYDAAILLLGLCPREMITFIHTKMWTWMFKAAIFITDQKQDLSIDKWISKCGISIQWGIVCS